MFLTALLLALIGTALTFVGARATFRWLQLDPLQTLMWFGLAELPAPPVSRRR